MSVKANYISGVLLGTGGYFLKTLLNLLLIPFLIARLGVESYGFYLFLASTSDTLAFLVDFGFGVGLVYKLTQYYSTDDMQATSNYLNLGHSLYLVLAVLLLVAGFGIVPVFTGVIHLTPSLKSICVPALQLIVIEAALTLYGSYYQSVLLARTQYQWTNLSEISRIIGTNLITLALIMLHFGLIEVLMARIAGAGLRNLILLYAGLRQEKRLLHVSFRPCLSTLHNLFSFSLLAMIRRMGVVLAHKIDDYVIITNLSLGSVAVFGIVFKIFSQVGVLGFKVCEGLFPLFTKMVAQAENERAGFFFIRISCFISFLATFLIMLIAVYYVPLFHFFSAGKVDINQTWTLACLAALIIWSSIMQAPGDNFLFAAGRARFQTVSTVVTSVVNLGLSLFLVRQIGLEGVALGTLIPHFVQNQLFTVRVACQDLNIRLLDYLKQVHLRNVIPIAGGFLWLLLTNQFLPTGFTTLSYALIALNSLCTLLISSMLWLTFSTTDYEKELISQKWQRLQPVFSVKPKVIDDELA